MATDGPIDRDEELTDAPEASTPELTAEDVLDESETADATPWGQIEDEEAGDDVEAPTASEIAKPIIAAAEEVLQPAIAAVVERDAEQDAPDRATMAVSSAAVVPTEDDLQVDSEVDEDDSVLRIGQADAADITPAAVVGSRGGWWTIPTLCAGLAIVACSLIIPQTDTNRRLAWEREKLERDLKSIQKQVDVNGQFLEAVADDANLAERLAQRQMKVYRQGTAVLELQRQGKDEMSPFLLTAVVPPDPLPPYQSRGGTLATLFLHPKHSLYLSGLGLLLIATGLVMGGEKRREA